MTNKEKFIDNAIKKHGDKYDYSNVKYVNNHTKVCIICPEHGEFWQTPASHLNNKGCKKCSFKKMGIEKTLTQEEFINRIKKIHGNKYSIDNVIYTSNRTYIFPECNKHGIFKVLASNFMKGQGCPKCVHEETSNRMKMTKSQFLLKAREIHGWKYDYSKIDFIDSQTKILIICPEHGEFWQTPACHLNTTGCPICGKLTRAKNTTKTTKEFIEKARAIHGNKYDYSKSNYINSKEKICIICPEHGEFWQRSSAHIDGQGCPKCADNQKMTKNEFIEKARAIHGNKYDYSNVNYEKNYKKICIICPEHGEFWQTPHVHLKGSGCPKCKKEYKLEQEIRMLLDNEKIKYEEQKTFDGMVYKSSLKLDFYLPEYNTAIECQGEQHFKPVMFGNKRDADKEFKTNIKRDEAKRLFCKKNKIKLVYFNHLTNIKSNYKIFHSHKGLLNEIRGN